MVEIQTFKNKRTNKKSMDKWAIILEKTHVGLAYKHTDEQISWSTQANMSAAASGKDLTATDRKSNISITSSCRCFPLLITLFINGLNTANAGIKDLNKL